MAGTHVVDSRKRTEDILTAIKVDFESFLLTPMVLAGLTLNGFGTTIANSVGSHPTC